MRYDAVIVGAGLAGLYAGSKLARAGWSVCIIDRRRRIGEPVRCGEATGNRAELSRFVRVEESWIARDIAGLSVHVNDTFSLDRAIPDAGVVLHRDRFEAALAADAENAGARVMLGTQAAGLRRDGLSFESVVLDNGTEVAGRVIIGADGAESRVGQWAGITAPLALADSFSSVQYRVRSRFCCGGHLHFFVGSRHIQRGYIWVFPKSEDEISVGAGVYGPRGGRERAGEYLDRFVARFMPESTKENLITGCVPLAIRPTKLHKGNILLIGDAARQCNPLTAGGIMNSLEAADLAVRTLVSSDARRGGVIPAAYSRAQAGRPRWEQMVFAAIKDLVVESDDARLVRMIRAASAAFPTAIDRGKPFVPPVGAALRLALPLLPSLAWRSMRKYTAGPSHLA
jgi:digeranylgeranylglycerophospholipid reductase